MSASASRPARPHDRLRVALAPMRRKIRAAHEAPDFARSRGVHREPMTGLIYAWPSDARTVAAARRLAEELCRRHPEFLPNYELREEAKIIGAGSDADRLLRRMWAHYCRSLEAACGSASHPGFDDYAAAYLADPGRSGAAWDELRLAWKPRACADLPPGLSYWRTADTG